MTNIMELTPDSEEWVGPKKLSGKHIEFVETYMRLTGSQKTLKNTAIECGYRPATASSNGSLIWSYTIVKQYYHMLLEQHQNRLLEVYYKATDNLIDIGNSSQDENTRIATNLELVKLLQPIINSKMITTENNNSELDNKSDELDKLEIMSTFNEISKLVPKEREEG